MKNSGISDSVKSMTNAEQPTQLRSRQQIDEEYTRCATMLGDLDFKIKDQQAQCDLLRIRMSQIFREPAEIPGPVPALPQAPPAPIQIKRSNGKKKS